MPSPSRRQLNMRIAPEDEDVIDRMQALARKNGRDLVDEVVHAMRRHVAQPPTVTVHEPKLEPATVEPKPQKKRGRPPKAK